MKTVFILHFQQINAYKLYQIIFIFTTGINSSPPSAAYRRQLMGQHYFRLWHGADLGERVCGGWWGGVGVCGEGIKSTCHSTSMEERVHVNVLCLNRPMYAGAFGGISDSSKEHFIKVNGFSNVYFGWGAEDDDMALR